MKPICIIAARGGSKGVPKKNIRLLGKKPLIAYTIESAIKSKLFSNVIVSTENKKIANIAKKYKAEVPFSRPMRLADDYVGTSEVVVHAINWLQKNGHQPTDICCIYPTASLMQVKDLKASLKHLRSGRWEYIFSATTFDHPIFKSFTFNKLVSAS